MRKTVHHDPLLPVLRCSSIAICMKMFFARVPESTHYAGPILRQLDHLLNDDRPYQQIREDLGNRLFAHFWSI